MFNVAIQWWTAFEKQKDTIHESSLVFIKENLVEEHTVAIYCVYRSDRYVTGGVPTGMHASRNKLGR